MKERIKGFTYIEVLIVMMISGLLILSLFNLTVNSIKIWENINTSIDLRQQARIINYFLDRDLRKAIDVKLSTDNNEIWLNLGRNGDEFDNTDQDTDYYLQYRVHENRLTLKKTTASFNNSGVSYPQWPQKSDWGFNRSITMEIIEDYQFDIQENILTYKIKLVSNNNSYYLKNKIFINYNKR